MRRSAAALAVLLSVPAVAQRQIAGLDHHEPTAVHDSLRGPVRSVRFQQGFTEPANGQVVLVTTYDRTGRRAEMLIYRGNDLRSRAVYTYDERGRNTGWEFYEVPRSGGPHTPHYESPPGTPLPTVPERRVYVLDDAGRRLEDHDIRPNGSLRSRIVYEYDSGGRVHVMAAFDHSGRPAWRHDIEYDSAGQLLDEQWVTRYDSLGRRREVEVREEGEVRWRTEYHYDAEGRLSEEETRDLKPHGPPQPGNPEPRKIVYRYHPDGTRTMETVRLGRDGAPEARVVDRFDANGRLVEREHFRPDGTRDPRLVFDPAQGTNVEVAGLTRWTEELDAHGNWIRRAYILIPDGGAPMTLWEHVREITYW
jgi:hypothetical protein